MGREEKEGLVTQLLSNSREHLTGVPESACNAAFGFSQAV